MKHLKLFETAAPNNSPIISIRTKVKGKSIYTSIPTSLEYEQEKEIEYLMKDIARMVEYLNPSAELDVSYMVHNNIGGSWMEMYTYYPTEKRFIKLT